VGKFCERLFLPTKKEELGIAAIWERFFLSLRTILGSFGDGWGFGAAATQSCIDSTQKNPDGTTKLCCDSAYIYLMASQVPLAWKTNNRVRVFIVFSPHLETGTIGTLQMMHADS
jgi:hypothetical protein